MEVVYFFVKHWWLFVCLCGFGVCAGYVIMANVYASRPGKMAIDADEESGLAVVIVREFLGIREKVKGAVLFAAILATIFFVLFADQIIRAIT